jgi:dihydroflavonol-4-reductase
VPIAINIGSYYPHVAKHLMANDRYMQSRWAAYQGISALRSSDFRVISVDAPFVVGSVPGLKTSYDPYVQYAQGKFEGVPIFAPPGGVNFVSADTVADAVEAVVTKGENGRAYLIGDENASFQQFLGAFFEGLGKSAPPVIDQEHPLLPDSLITWGRGNNLHYETDPAETAMLAYRRNDAMRAIREDIVPQYLERESAAAS